MDPVGDLEEAVVDMEKAVGVSGGAAAAAADGGAAAGSAQGLQVLGEELVADPPVVAGAVAEQVLDPTLAGNSRTGVFKNKRYSLS